MTQPRAHRPAGIANPSGDEARSAAEGCCTPTCSASGNPAQPVEWVSILTCPACGAASAQTMPEDACLWCFTCPSCGAELRPLPGDCCVFCSYGSAPCPPVQRAATGA